MGFLGVRPDFREHVQQPASEVALFECTADFGQVAEPTFGCVHGAARVGMVVQALVVGLERRRDPDPERAVAAVALGEFDDLVELNVDEALRETEAVPLEGGPPSAAQGRDALARMVREGAARRSGDGGVAEAQVARASRLLPKTSDVRVRAACGTWSKYGPVVARAEAKMMLEFAVLGRRGWFGHMWHWPFIPMSPRGTPWQGE